MLFRQDLIKLEKFGRKRKKTADRKKGIKGIPPLFSMRAELRILDFPTMALGERGGKKEVSAKGKKDREKEIGSASDRTGEQLTVLT